MNEPLKCENTRKPSMERPWMKYYPKDADTLEFPRCSLYAFLKKAVHSNPEGNAIYYYGKRLNYSELLEQVDRCADTFAVFGVKSGEIVSFLSVTTPETIFAMYALNKIGAVSNFIDPRMDVLRIQEAVTNVRSRVLIALDKTWPKLEKLLPGLPPQQVIIQTPADSLPFSKRLVRAVRGERKADVPYDKFQGVNGWKDFLQLGIPGRAKEVRFNSGELAVITYTGGTTGLPKGVMLTNEGMNAVAQSFALAGSDHVWGERFLDIMPVFASYGVVCGIHMPVAARFENVLVPDFVADRIGILVQKYRPACMMGVPSFYERLMHSKKVLGKNLSFLRTTGCGGDTMNASLESRFNEFLRDHGGKYPLCQGYGMSEISSAATCCFGNVYKDGSAGIPLIATTVGIFSPETGEELGYYQDGEVCLSGPSVMKGYYNNPEETDQVLRRHPDGTKWIHSGDIGHLDEDGFLFINGRIKQIIIRFDGHKVFPVQIECAINSSEAVATCAVVGIPDRAHAQGMVPLGVVELANSNMSCAEKEMVRRSILALCNDELEERGKPVDIVFVDAMPHTSMGKNNYSMLTKEFAGYIPAAQ